jgi:hypothetical protein
MAAPPVLITRSFVEEAIRQDALPLDRARSR